MCHSILLVTYNTGTSAAPKPIMIASQREQELRIEQLCKSVSVVMISVFQRHHDVALEKRWTEKMYTPPLDVPEPKPVVRVGDLAPAEPEVIELEPATA